MDVEREFLHTVGEWVLEGAPDNAIPEDPMAAIAAMRLVEEELAVEGIPERNLATFVTTWMEPEARLVIEQNLHRNFIDHAEYPQTFAIQQRCIRMLAELFHAPGETTGTSTQGSSEAIMLGALSLKWKWRQRREAAGKPTDSPNLVFGGDVHVVWEKFCRYFDVEPRIVPLQPGKYTVGPEDIEPHLDENTIGVAAVVGTTFTGHADDVVGINDLLVDAEERARASTSRCTSTVPAAASSGPSSIPHSEWDFRLEQVRSINASGHKFGLVYPGIGWLIFREKSDLAEDLVFYENYLGKTDATFTLNFSTGSSMVLAQYYNFVRFGKAGYRRIMEIMQSERRVAGLRHRGHRQVPDHRQGRGDAAAGRLQPRRGSPLRRVRHRLPAGRGAGLDGARIQDAAERPGREDDARPREAEPQPLAGRHPARGHRGRDQDTRGEGPRERVRAQAGQDERHPLTRGEVVSRRTPRRPESLPEPAAGPRPRACREAPAPSRVASSRARPSPCRAGPRR